MSSRSNRKGIAEQTVRILDAGSYEKDGGQVSISEMLEASKRGTKLFRPDHVFPEHFEEQASPTKFLVENCTTFAAAARLVSEQGKTQVGCLNFASAKNPGGGFLNGSQAQEEALARASGLYPCLLTQPEYYETNRKCGTALYTNHLIFSPEVPVIRDDNDGLLSEPYTVSILTSPAVNAGAVTQNEPKNVDRIEPVMVERIEHLFRSALTEGIRHLILGAWGCGVFRNDPTVIAGLFREALIHPEFHNRFKTVFFAVWDRSDDLKFLRPFEKGFN